MRTFNPLNSKIDITLYELYTTFCYSPVELTTLGTHKRTDRYWADHGIVLAPIQASVSFAGQVVYTIDAIDMHDLGAAKWKSINILWICLHAFVYDNNESRLVYYCDKIVIKQ